MLLIQITNLRVALKRVNETLISYLVVILNCGFQQVLHLDEILGLNYNRQNPVV